MRDAPMNLTRRQALTGAALSFGAVWATLSVPAGAAAQATATVPLSWQPRALTPQQARALDAMAELIVPATDTPGARAAGVPQFVDRAVADYYEPPEAALIRAGLDRLDADAEADQGVAFAALGAERQKALLGAYEAEAGRQPRGAAHFFPLLKELVTVGYFTSEPGATQALRYDPMPGHYLGCVPLSDIGRAWATA
jgi:gluconate 2-dehydrogenase gamma chain